uniref:Sodium/hydrogen exchanger n=1 Tax=Caenorhabditis japonica TaxID=281687 RepID=A0A8R1HUN9_CAEJA
MDEEGEWVHHAPPEEIEEAKHLLDKIHVDTSLTGKPLAFIGLILLVTILKPTLHWKFIRWFPEAVILMAYGVTGALIIRYFTSIKVEQLDTYFFFMILLPAIVNDAGLSMQKKEFFQGLPKIMLYAVVGTVITSLLLATALYACETSFQFNPAYLHLLVFATLICAVDPVSVLSTFAELDVKKALFTLVFGESLCNDAVTIVLYRTSINVIKNQDASEATLTILGVAGECAVQFCIVCFVGIAIGLLFGLIGIIIMRQNVGHQMNQPVFQLCFPYLAYLIAETGHFSGILASITCAAFMAVYMPANMCVEMEFAALTFSKTGSSISESCIFFYLGVSIVSNDHAFDWAFIFVTVGCCLLFRFVVTVGLTAFYNLFTIKKNKIPFTDQLVVTHAGIRGAVCFGLVQIIDERIIPAKPYFVTTTLVMIVFTSVVQGCSIKWVMEKLKIPGDDGSKQDDTMAFSLLSSFNNKVLKKILSSESSNYQPTDGTFRNLNLPKTVSTALRIGERSHTDLTRHGEVSPLPAPQISVGRPTVSPFTVDFSNADDTAISTGRRTPVARNASRYSRHFIYTAGANELDSYLTCPVRGPMRPTFDPNQLYNNQNTISNPGDADRARCINRRHNSMGADSIELKNLTKSLPLEKKISRTVTSGNKKFVVNPEDFINEESPSTSTSTKKKATFEDDEISKIDDCE